MTASERAQMLFTARLLQAAETIDWLSTGLTLLAAAAIVFGTPHPAAAKNHVSCTPPGACGDLVPRTPSSEAENGRSLPSIRWPQ